MPALNRQRGLTLVELLVAITLGALALATMVGVFIANSRNYRQNDAITALQDNARFAMDNLSRDLAMAGYWGGVRPIDAARSVLVSASAAAAVAGSAVPGDCGPATPPSSGSFLLQPGLPLEFANHTEAAGLSARFRCLSQVQAGSDVVMIRRASGQPAREVAAGGNAAIALVAGRIYLKSNQSVASLIRPASANHNVAEAMDCIEPGTGIATGCPPQELPAQFYAYRPSLYFVHPASEALRVSTLCRYVLRDDQAGAAPAMEEDCLAEGVENLQLEWGIDTDNDAQQTADVYLANPDAAQLSLARSVRIHLLVRAADEGLPASADEKEYRLADYDSSQDPAFQRAGLLRRAFSTTVQIKNLRP